jgi:peptidoglycan/LPS O-acetylase OafA/YrhL
MDDLSVAFISYTYSSAITTLILKLGLPYGYVLYDYMVTGASGIFIIYAIGSIKLSNLLLRKPFIFLGKISYSLYLIHLIVLFSFMYLFYGSLPNPLIYLFTVFYSLLFATLCWRFIENPSIALGQRLTKVNRTERISQKDWMALEKR